MSSSVAAKAAQRMKEGGRTVELPQGVTASVKGRELLVKGPNGSATKVFQRIPVDVEVKGNQVRLGIEAPGDVRIYREEVYRAIRKENEEAGRSDPGVIVFLSDQ